MRRSPLSTPIDRPLPETMPDVTENEYVPSGLPMAMTSWPIFRPSALPSSADGKSGGVDLDDARSVRVSMP